MCLSFVLEQERLWEVLTSTGSAEWSDVDDVHYPSTYAHGCYNRETTIVDSRPVLKLRIGGDEPINMKNIELLSYLHEVNFRNVTVMWRLRFRDRRVAR